MNLKFEDCSQDFSPILGIPDTISDDLRCPPINQRRPPNNLRLDARFCVGLEIQVEIQCLRVVSGELLQNPRRPATIRTLSVIVSDDSYGGIVVNRRVYKGASDRIAKSLRRSCCRRRRQKILKMFADIVSDRHRCNWRRSEANPTIFRQNRVKILEKISDNVTAPLLLGLLLRLFKDSLFSTTTPGQN